MDDSQPSHLASSVCGRNVKQKRSALPCALICFVVLLSLHLCCVPGDTGEKGDKGDKGEDGVGIKGSPGAPGAPGEAASCFVGGFSLWFKWNFVPVLLTLYFISRSFWPFKKPTSSAKLLNVK